MQFTGVLLNHFDQNYYQAAQRSTAHDLPNRNRFTAEPGAPGPVSPLYPLLGWVERITGLPGLVMYHLPRILAVVALPAALAYMFSLCFPARRGAALWATVFALFAAGPLALAPGLPLAALSGEHIHESNVLYSLTVFPHFSISYLGITLTYTALAMALRGHRASRIAAIAAGAGTLLALGHAFLLLPFLFVLLGFLVVNVAPAVRRRTLSPKVVRLLAAGAAFVPAAPVLYALRREQVRLEELQGRHFPSLVADAWWTWPLGFGIVSVLAVAGCGALMATRRRDPLTWMLLGWIGVQFAFIYLPQTVFQRRFSEGLILPVAAVAGAGLVLLHPSSAPGRALRGGAATFLLAGAMAITNLLGSTGQYLRDHVIDLAATVRSGDIVLAGPRLSAILPALSDGIAHAARPVETLHYERKRQEAVRYARDPADPEARRWLRHEGITMVVVTDEDLAFSPRRLDRPQACLRPVFKRGGLLAYRVESRCLADAEEATPGGYELSASPVASRESTPMARVVEGHEGTRRRGGKQAEYDALGWAPW